MRNSSNKSYVSMEQHVCRACGVLFSTDVILLDQRLRNSLETHTVTGYGTCYDCATLIKQGYTFCIEIDESASTIEDGAVLRSEAHRTGRIAKLKYNAWKFVFGDEEIPAGNIVFVSNQVMDIIEQLFNKTQETGEGQSQTFSDPTSTG